MGFADFLAQVGGGTGIGRIGEAFGGETDAEKRLRPFVRDQLPAMMEQLRKTTDEQTGRDLLGQIYEQAAQAGVGPQSMERLHVMLQKPFMERMQRQQIDAALAPYRPQTTPLTPTVAPQGQGEQLPESTTFGLQTTPGKPLDQEGIIAYAKAARATPEQFKNLLEAPGTIGEKEAKRKQEEQKYTAIENLPTTPIPGMGGITYQDYGRATGGQIGPLAPQKELSEGEQKFKERKLEIDKMVTEGRMSIAEGNAQLQRARADLAVENRNRAEQGRTFTQERQLRNEFITTTAPFRQKRDAYNNVVASAAVKSPNQQTQNAADIALVYNFIKFQDPSIVSATEFALPNKAQPLLEKYGLTGLQKVLTGAILSPEQRQGLLNQVNTQYQRLREQHQKQVGETQREARSYGLDPNRVTMDLEAIAPPTEAPQAPTGGLPPGVTVRRRQ